MYIFPEYYVYAVCGGFGAVLLAFIIGCFVMSRRRGTSDVRIGYMCLSFSLHIAIKVACTNNMGLA